MICCSVGNRSGICVPPMCGIVSPFFSEVPCRNAPCFVARRIFTMVRGAIWREKAARVHLPQGLRFRGCSLHLWNSRWDHKIDPIIDIFYIHAGNIIFQTVPDPIELLQDPPGFEVQLRPPFWNQTSNAPIFKMHPTHWVLVPTNFPQWSIYEIFINLPWYKSLLSYSLNLFHFISSVHYISFLNAPTIPPHYMYIMTNFNNTMQYPEMILIDYKL